MRTAAVVSTIFTWFVGLFIDANLGMGDFTGFLELRVVLPLIVMGLFVMSSNRGDKK